MRRFQVLAVAFAAVATVALGLTVLGPAPAGATSGLTLTPIAKVLFNPQIGGVETHGAFLPDGHLLVDNTRDGTIVEMNPDGSGQTLFASGLAGPLGMTVVVTSASAPVSGYVYVACAGALATSMSPKIPGSVVRFNLDGSGQRSFTSSQSYTFNDPRDVAADASGDVYVADGTTLAEITASGSIQSVSSSFSAIDAVAVDPSSGDIYVGDEQTSEISYLAPGSSTVNSWSSSYLTSALAVDAGRLVVANEDTSFPYPLQLVSMPLAPSSGSTTALEVPAHVAALTGLAVAPSGITGVAAGDLYIGAMALVDDPNTNSLKGDAEVFHAAANGTSARLIAIGGGPSAQRFTQMTFDSTTDKLFAIDETLGSVVEMNTDGSDQQTVVSGYDTLDYDWPTYVAVDPVSGDIFVTDVHLGGTNHVEEYPPAGGTPSTGTVLAGSTPSSPVGIAVDNGKLLVENSPPSGACSIEEGGFDGAGFTTFGSNGCATSLTMGIDGDVYAVQPSASLGSVGATIAKYTASGTFEGQLSLPQNAAPLQAAVDASGRVFVTDTSNGLDMVSSAGLGPQVIDGSQADYLGVTADGSGNVFLGDSSEIDALSGLPTVPSITSMSVHQEAGPAASGPCGSTAVVITGSNLSAASLVDVVASTDLSDVASWSTPTSSSATQIMVTISRCIGDGTYDLVVVTPGGVSEINGQTGFIVASPPAITSLSPASGSMLGGTKVTITGLHFSTATG